MKTLLSQERRLAILLGLAVLWLHGCAPRAERDLPEEAGSTGWLESSFAPLPARVRPGISPGRASLIPDRFEAAEVGRYRLRFQVGRGGIATGGGLLVEFPKAWFASLVPLSKPFQTEHEEAPHFIGVELSRIGSGLQLALEREGLVGKLQRFPDVVHVIVEDEPLVEGDEILVTLANTSAPFISGRDAVRVAVDATGSGDYQFIERAAEYEVVSGPPVKIYLLGASEAVVGQSHELQVTLLDRFFNPAAAASSRVVVTGVEDEPIAVGFSRDQPWRGTVRWIPRAPGFCWPRLRGVLTLHEKAEAQPVAVDGDPILVYPAGEPLERTFWGDIQSHSAISHDGIGHRGFEYARDVTRLDFYASTEHADDSGSGINERDGITLEEWRWIREQVRSFYDPGHFATLLGFESTLRHGHHCVYFRDLEGVPIPPRQVKLVEELWRVLPVGDAITVPHHLGRRTRPILEAVEGPGIDQLRFGIRAEIHRGPVLHWDDPHSPSFRPLLEIYSSHGSSELFDREDALAYEHAGYLPSLSATGPHYARDAWAAGHRMGVIASSDNHVAHPGLRHTGLAAVVASELTRDEVFSALTARCTYGTTGVRILLRFYVAGTAMGGVTRARGRIGGSVLVAAPGEIRFAEVVALDTGSNDWRIAARWEEPGHLLETSFEDRLGDRGSTYYLRVELVEPVEGHPARAWSSPVWVEPSPSARPELPTRRAARSGTTAGGRQRDRGRNRG